MKFRGVVYLTFESEESGLDDFSATMIVQDPIGDEPRPRVLVYKGYDSTFGHPNIKITIPYEEFMIIYSGHARAKEVTKLILSRRIKVTGWKDIAKFARGFEYHKELWFGLYAERERQKNEGNNGFHALKENDPKSPLNGKFLFTSDSFRKCDSYYKLPSGKSRNKLTPEEISKRAKQKCGSGSGSGSKSDGASPMKMTLHAYPNEFGLLHFEIIYFKPEFVFFLLKNATLRMKLNKSAQNVRRCSTTTGDFSFDRKQTKNFNLPKNIVCGDVGDWVGMADCARYDWESGQNDE